MSQGRPVCVFYIYFSFFLFMQIVEPNLVYSRCYLLSLTDKVVKWVRVNSKGHVFKELKFHWTDKLWEENF